MASKFEAWQEPPLDVYVYNPLSAALVDPAHRVGLTPNQVTSLSKVAMACAVAALLCDAPLVAGALYLAHYVLDCVDGKLARAYGQTSVFGMLYDFSSDVVGHVVLGLAQVLHNGGHLGYFAALAALSLLNAAYYGVAMAVCNLERYGNDNFPARLEATAGLRLGPASSSLHPRWMVEVFVRCHRTGYGLYQSLRGATGLAPEALLAGLRHVGPGTFATLVALDLVMDVGGRAFQGTVADAVLALDGVPAPTVCIGAAVAAALIAHHGSLVVYKAILAAAAVQVYVALCVLRNNAGLGLGCLCGALAIQRLVKSRASAP